jgi:NAD+ kinase
MVDPSSLEVGQIGQADQEAWAHEMSKSPSQLDLKQSEDIHSRMLTKKQLSDMAWGVRELSRRLSSMRIRFRVKTIFLLTKVYDQDLIPKTRELTKWLLHSERDVSYIVYVQDKLKTNKKFDVAGILDEVAKSYSADDGIDFATARERLEHRLRYWDEPMCRSRPHMFDFVITLGGDGTVLYASWLFQRIVPPVLSFALGSLGFLTKFDFTDHKRILTSAFDRGVTVSLRLRFESTVMRSIRRKYSDDEKGSGEEDDDLHSRRDLVEELIGEEKEDEHTHRPDGTFEILNEVVVDRGPNPSKCRSVHCSGTRRPLTDQSSHVIH